MEKAEKFRGGSRPVASPRERVESRCSRATHGVPLKHSQRGEGEDKKEQIVPSKGR